MRHIILDLVSHLFLQGCPKSLDGAEKDKKAALGSQR